VPSSQAAGAQSTNGDHRNRSPRPQAARVEEVPDEDDPFRFQERFPSPGAQEDESINDHDHDARPHTPSPLDADEEGLLRTIYAKVTLDDLRTSLAFINALHAASLDGPHSELEPKTLARTK
jgi:hypothetical protein